MIRIEHPLFKLQLHRGEATVLKGPDWTKQHAENAYWLAEPGGHDPDPELTRAKAVADFFDADLVDERTTEPDYEPGRIY